jgi:hypothetical protein
MSTGDGYALDLGSPVSHVAARLERAAGAALSVEDMAADYQHPNPGDVARVKSAEGCASDTEVSRRLIEKAVDELTYKGKTSRSKRQLVNENGGIRFAADVSIDDLEWNGRQVYALRNDHAALRDAFNPQSGRFSENVRRNTGKDSMNGLRESMREFGWIKQLPAIKDERGVVLVGHRRLAVAAELGIPPHEQSVEVVSFGKGDEADAKRFRLAIASNLDAKPFTPQERADLAEYLCGEHEWTEARIAQALNVSPSTVQNDLRGFTPPVKPHRPKGGRPKGSRMVDNPAMRADIRNKLAAGEPVIASHIAKAHDVGKSTAEHAVMIELEASERLEGATVVLNVPEQHEHKWTCVTCGAEWVG